MKRILSLTLAFALLLSALSLISCGKVKDGDTVERLATKTPYELYTSERSVLIKASEYSLVTTQTNLQEFDGTSKSATRTSINKLSGNNSYAKVTNDSDSSLNREAWYIDGVRYTSMFGKKTKSDYNQTSFYNEYMAANSPLTTMIMLEESMFDGKVFERSEGYWVLSLTLSAEWYMQQLNSVSASGNVLPNVMSGDVTYKLYFNDSGKIQKIFTAYDVNTSEFKAHYETTTEVELDNVTVSAPADASKYQYTALP